MQICIISTITKYWRLLIVLSTGRGLMSTGRSPHKELGSNGHRICRPVDLFAESSVELGVRTNFMASGRIDIVAVVIYSISSFLFLFLFCSLFIAFLLFFVYSISLVTLVVGVFFVLFLASSLLLCIYLVFLVIV